MRINASVRASLQKTGLIDPLIDQFLLRLAETDDLGGEFKQRLIANEVRVWEKVLSLGGRKKTPGYLHPSSMSCLRAMILKMAFPTPSPILTREVRSFKHVFNVGDSFHARMQALLLTLGEYPDSGITTCLDWIEYEFRDERLKIEGTIDQIVELAGGEKILVDFKSIGPRRYTKLPDSALVKDAPQIYAYLRSRGIRRGVLYYESKDAITESDGGVREFILEDGPEADFVETAYSDIYGTVVEGKPLPPRVSEDPDQLPCRWCAFAPDCFTLKSEYLTKEQTHAAKCALCPQASTRPSLFRRRDHSVVDVHAG